MLLLFSHGMHEQRILVVSATPDTAAWLSETLEATGDRIDVVTDGRDAFQRVWDANYDIIVAELGGPGVDGRDLYMAFQNTWPELTRRMVFVCAEPNPTVEAFALRAAVPVLRAPASAEDLRETVRNVSGFRRSRALLAK